MTAQLTNGIRKIQLVKLFAIIVLSYLALGACDDDGELDWENQFVMIPAETCEQVRYSGEESAALTPLYRDERGVRALNAGVGMGWAVECPVDFFHSRHRDATILDFDAWGSDLCPEVTPGWLAAGLFRRERAAGNWPLVVETCRIEDGETHCDRDLDFAVGDETHSYYVHFEVPRGDELCWRARMVRIWYRFPRY